MDRSLTLFELKIPHDEIAEASKQESAFFLNSMTILHDIYALQRAVLFSEKALRGEKIDSPVISAQVAQSFAFIKALAGILCEAYDYIQFGFYADSNVPLRCCAYRKYKERKETIIKYKMVNLTSKYFCLMNKEALQASKNIETYFSKPNSLRHLRNKYAFHYDFKEALKHFDKFYGIDDPHFFLEESSSNCCYVAANQWLILRALDVNPNDIVKLKEKFDSLMAESVAQAKNIATFLHGYILAFSEKYLKLDLSKANRSVLENVMFLDEILFPFFSKRNA